MEEQCHICCRWTFTCHELWLINKSTLASWVHLIEKFKEHSFHLFGRLTQLRGAFQNVRLRTAAGGRKGDACPWMWCEERLSYGKPFVGREECGKTVSCNNALFDLIEEEERTLHSVFPVAWRPHCGHYKSWDQEWWSAREREEAECHEPSP